MERGLEAGLIGIILLGRLEGGDLNGRPGKLERKAVSFGRNSSKYLP
jgi:hypothetical protein